MGSIKYICIIIIIKLIFSTGLINAQSKSTPYSFFIAGHTYGKPGVNNIGLHPPFKEKFNYIRQRDEIKFGVFTGDIVSANPIAQDWDEVDADIENLGLPIYFAVGNHDMENRILFESRYGDTYYSFIYQNDLFIVLDPNFDEWNISGDQLEFLIDIVENNNESVDNIFVFFHQLLWRTNNNIYSNVHPNSTAGMADTINFWTEIEPIFNELSNQVFMCCGDVGAACWSADFMYDNYDNISFIASGMGEDDGDNFIIFNSDTDKNISYDLICINEPELNCFGELTAYQISPNGIPDLVQQEIIVYPNPASNNITIEVKNKLPSNINILNMRGELMIRKEHIYKAIINIDISTLSSGIYLITISNHNSHSTTKLVIQ